jgi:hypothetical protein
MKSKPAKATAPDSKPAVKRKLKPAEIYCHGLSCHARLVVAEIDGNGRPGWICPACGVAYCLQRHPYRNHCVVVRYLPAVTESGAIDPD